MARVFEDGGTHAVVAKPLRLRRFEAGNLPDSGECVDCLIIVNDRRDGVPRGRLYLSNGASWDPVAYLGEGIPAASSTVDVVPLVQKAVAEAVAALPQPVQMLTPAPIPLALPSPGPSRDVLALARRCEDLAAQVHVLAERIQFLEENAINEVRLVEVA